MLQAVFFDFGNTLVSTRLDWARILPENLQGLAEALRDKVPGIDFQRLGADLLFLRQAGGRRAAETLIEVPAVESLRAALALQISPPDAAAFEPPCGRWDCAWRSFPTPPVAG